MQRLRVTSGLQDAYEQYPEAPQRRKHGETGNIVTAKKAHKSKSLRRTKIVATVGPGSSNQDMIGRLLSAGVDVFRLNFSHGAQSDHIQVAQHIRRQARHHGRYVGILADLQGPKIRIAGFADGAVNLQAGDPFQLSLTIAPDAGDHRGVCVEYTALPSSVEQDDVLLLDDGKLRLRVDDVSQTEVNCTVVVGGRLSAGAVGAGASRRPGLTISPPKAASTSAVVYGAVAKYCSGVSFAAPPKKSMKKIDLSTNLYT